MNHLTLIRWINSEARSDEIILKHINEDNKNELSFYGGKTFLMLGIIHGRSFNFAKELINMGIDLNQKDYANRSAFDHFFLRYGLLRKESKDGSILLSGRASMKNGKKNTCLSWTDKELENFITLMIEKGADLMQETTLSQTALHRGLMLYKIGKYHLRTVQL